MKKRIGILSFLIGTCLMLPGCLKKKTDDKKEKAKKTALVKRVIQKEMIEDTQNS